MANLQKRFRKLESALTVLVERYKVYQQIEDEKRKVAKEIVGLNYYWGEYSGELTPCESDATKVIAKLVHQKTGAECHWILDAFHVLEHLHTIAKYNSWEEYQRARMLYFAEDYEKLLIRSGYSKERIDQMMRSYCAKYEVPFKAYLQDAS